MDEVKLYLEEIDIYFIKDIDILYQCFKLMN